MSLQSNTPKKKTSISQQLPTSPQRPKLGLPQSLLLTLRSEPCSREERLEDPSPQALAPLNDQVVARHVVGGFRGQKDDGSLQVRPPSQPSRGNVRQPALHQRLQGLGADERRVHNAPAKSTHGTGLWMGLTKRKGRTHVFEVLNQKENYEVVLRRAASCTVCASTESHHKNFGSTSYLPSFTTAGQAQRIYFKQRTHTLFSCLIMLPSNFQITHHNLQISYFLQKTSMALETEVPRVSSVATFGNCCPFSDFSFQSIMLLGMFVYSPETENSPTFHTSKNKSQHLAQSQTLSTQKRRDTAQSNSP